MDLVVIKQGDQVEINLLKGILDQNKIDSMIETKQGSGFVMRAGNVLEEYYLLVRKEDEEAAKELAEAFFEE